MATAAAPPAILGFLTPLAGYALSEGEAPESWIQVAVAGEFEDPGRYGKFSITPDDLTAMALNFSEGRFPVPPTEICVDYDHLITRISKPGDGKAAGWFKELQVRADGAELWARVAWTPAGAEAVKTGEYKFFSPRFTKDYCTSAGDKIGPTLLNGAITNQPFLQGMQPLALSRVVALATLTDNDQRARVEEALMKRFNYYYDEPACCYLVDTIGGNTAIFRGHKGRTYAIPYAVAEDGTVSFSGDPAEVVVQYAPLAGAGGTQLMAKTITLAAANGQTVTIDPAVLEDTELVRSLRAQLPKDGQQVVAAAEYSALQGQVTELGAQVKALGERLTTEETKSKEAQLQLARRDATDKVDVLIRAGKATPAEKDSLVELALANADLFGKLTAARPQVVPLSAVGSSTTVPAPDSAEAALEAKAKEIAASEKCSIEKAFSLAMERHPELYSKAEQERERAVALAGR